LFLPGSKKGAKSHTLTHRIKQPGNLRDNRVYRVVGNWCLWTFEVSEAWTAIIYGGASFISARKRGARETFCKLRLIYCTCKSTQQFPFYTRKEGSISYLCQTAKLVSLCALPGESEIFKYQQRGRALGCEVRMGGESLIKNAMIRLGI